MSFLFKNDVRECLFAGMEQWCGLYSHSRNDWAFRGSALARVRLVASNPRGVSLVTEAALHGDGTSPCYRYKMILFACGWVC